MIPTVNECISNLNVIGYPNEALWEELHFILDKENVLFPEKCWEQCNSHCCNLNHEMYNFTHLEKKGIGMLFSAVEYEFLKKSSKLQADFSDKAKQHFLKFSLGKKLSYVVSFCSLSGICTLSNYRPLICKMYPYLPIININKKCIEELIFCNPFDLFWQNLKISHPCWIHNNSIVKNLLSNSLPVILKHPYFIFYINAAAIFLKKIKINLNNEISFKEPKKFFNEFEKLYLNCKVINLKEYKQELTSLYTALARVYGDFKI